MSTQYTATYKVVLPQLVHCVHCDCKFVYEQTVIGSGVAATGLRYDTHEEAQEVADREARDHLNRQLNDPELCNAIPCRECFRYQPYMYKLVGRARYDGLGCLGYPLLILGLLVTTGSIGAATFLAAERPLLIGAAFGGAIAWIAGYFTLRHMNRLVARYDPNSEQLDERRRIAKSRALTLDAFDKLQASRARQAYIKHLGMLDTHRWQSPSAEKPEPLVIEWWVVPSMFMAGGTFTFRVTEYDHVTVTVPEDTEPNEVLKPYADSRSVVPFKVRVVPTRVHIDEQRLE